MSGIDKQDARICELLTVLQLKAQAKTCNGVPEVFLFLLSEPVSDDRIPPQLVPPSQAQALLDLLFQQENGEMTIRVALQEMARRYRGGADKPHDFQMLAQLVAPLIWQHHLQHGCINKTLCPLSAVTQLASEQYIDVTQMPWLPEALEHLLATHPYRTSTFTLLEILARFPVATVEVRSEVFALLQTAEASALPEILGARRHSPWHQVIEKLREPFPLSPNEFHLLRRLGNRLIAAGDTTIIDAQIELLDRYEPMP
ncbi:hypothetical protein [Mycobacteroides abscessus]